jgi:hypothetical protein
MNYVSSIVLISLLILVGCAKDNYHSLDPDISDQQITKDLSDCKNKALHAYYDQSSMSGTQVAGLVVSSALGGPIGGAAFGAVIGTNEDDKKMKRVDINPYVQKCMVEKGYEGTSN